MWAAAETTVVPVPWWAWAGFVGFTILGLVEHVVFKTGRFRAPARSYFDERQPFYVRNLAFILLPAAWCSPAGPSLRSSPASGVSCRPTCWCYRSACSRSACSGGGSNDSSDHPTAPSRTG